MGILKISGVSASGVGSVGGAGAGGGGGGSVVYTLVPVSTTVDEGSSVVFNITTTDMFDGTKIPYVITGVSAADISIGLTGYITITSNASQLVVPLTGDNTTEGVETLTLTSMGIAHAITVADTSVEPLGSPYSRSLYLDGTNDAIEVTTNDNSISDFVGLDTIFQDATAAWSVERDFRLHNTVGTASTKIFEYTDNSGGLINRYQIYIQINGTNLLMYVVNYPASGGSGWMGQWVYQANAVNHFANPTAAGMWHRVTITKNTGTSVDNATFSTYINGVKLTAGSWRWGLTHIPAVSHSNTTARKLVLAQAGDDVALGAIAFYNKELTQSEVWANYDGGAIESGAPDATKIMNINPLTTNTSSNLLHYWYYDQSSDVNELIQDKKSGTLQARVSNTTFAATSSVTTPQLPLLVATHQSSAIYINEAQSFYQIGSNIKWYSNPEGTDLLHSGSTYNFTPTTAGAATLYVQSTHNGTSQIIPLNYAVANPGYSTHSYNQLAENMNLISPDLGYSNFVNGSFAMTWWSNQAGTYNQWLYAFESDASNFVTYHGNVNSFFYRIRINGKDHYVQTPAVSGLPGKDAWVMRTFSWDCVAGTFKVYANGALAKTYTHEDLTIPIGAGSGVMKTKMARDMGKTANIAVYNNALTDEEAFEIMGGEGNIIAPGDTRDLRTLSSVDKIAEYWRINDDVFNNNSSDVLIGVNRINIPVPNSNPSSKSTDRP